MVQPLQFQLPNPLMQIQQIEQIRALQLQNQQMEDQIRAQQRQNQQSEESVRKQQSQPNSPRTPEPVLDEWLKSAAPRMGLFPDFEKVVFAGDVSITIDMIRLMTPSPFAADIAYYLGTNKLESLAISKMTLAEAARSIDRIEARIKK